MCVKKKSFILVSLSVKKKSIIDKAIVFVLAVNDACFLAFNLSSAPQISKTKPTTFL